MSSEGAYGRQGFNANAQGYGGSAGGGGASYNANDGAGSGYMAPSYGGGYGGGGGGGYGGGGYGGGGGGGQPQYGGSVPGGVDSFQGDRNDEDKSKTGKKSLALASLNQNVFIWLGFFTASLFVYFLLSGGDFSFLMTYGAMSRMFGFGILNVKTFKSQRSTGVSIKTLQLYTLVFLFRLASILRHEGYLPYDKSGDWLYHIIEILGLIFTSSALYATMVPYNRTYQKDLDTFGEMHVPEGFGAIYLAVPVFLLACVVHPNLNADFMSDMAWTYAMYLESVALIPQLYMFQKQTAGVVELLTAHFVAALGLGRVMEFFFWIYSYHELANSSGSKLPGYLALFSQFLQLVLMLDFFWYYFVAVKNATPLVLPSHGGMNAV